MLGAAWYGQGLRLLDISNARQVQQVGYYRVDAAQGITGSNSWDVAFRSVKKKGDYVYLFDMRAVSRCCASSRASPPPAA